jgi:hypothetical protein
MEIGLENDNHLKTTREYWITPSTALLTTKTILGN